MINITHFFTIYIDMSMKYKQDIQLRFDVPWLSLSENVVFTLFISFFEDHNKECFLRKDEQFSRCSLGEVCSQRLTTSPYI